MYCLENFYDHAWFQSTRWIEWERKRDNGRNDDNHEPIMVTFILTQLCDSSFDVANSFSILQKQQFFSFATEISVRTHNLKIFLKWELHFKFVDAINMYDDK